MIEGSHANEDNMTKRVVVAMTTEPHSINMTLALPWRPETGRKVRPNI